MMDEWSEMEALVQAVEFHLYFSGKVPCPQCRRYHFSPGTIGLNSIFAMQRPSDPKPSIRPLGYPCDHCRKYFIGDN